LTWQVIARRRRGPYKRCIAHQQRKRLPTMRHVIATTLLLLAAIHALPLVGVLSAERVGALYGITVQEPNLEILMRHRAVLFGLLAAFLAYAAFKPALHGLALLAAAVSVLSFMALAYTAGPYNSAVARVVMVDWVAVGLLLVGGAVHLRGLLLR
jgi:hypothetical protein